MNKFRKLVVFDTKDSTLSEKLGQFCEELVVFKTEKDYAGVLKPEDLAGADAFVCKMFERYDEEFLSKATDLKYIGVSSTGYDAFDAGYLKRRKIAFTNVPGYSAQAVAELSFSALLCIIRKTHTAFAEVKSGAYEVKGYLGTELGGKTIGIVGLGSIGRQMAEIAKGFGMEVLYHSRTRKAETEAELGVEYSDLDSLLQKSDVISLNCPNTPETRGLLSKERLGLLKDGAIVLNASRSALCDIGAIAKLDRPVYFWFDSLDDNEERQSLLDMENVFFTPHIGWFTKEAQKRLDNITVDNIKSFLNGAPKNLVN